MLQMKKLVSVILGFSMVLSASGTIFAQEQQAPVWDNTAVVQDAEHLFEEFPVQVDKMIDNAANLSISFQYLKTLPSGSEASVSVTDFSSGAEVFSSGFASSARLEWEDVEIDKTYGVVVTETAGGTTSRYAAMLKTFNTAADFPVNFTLGDYPVYSEYSASPSKIMLREAGLVVQCNHAETEECVPACSPSFYTQHIPQSQFNTFYGTLESDKLYQIQTNAVVEGVQRNFNGFISTFEGGEYLGVFTRSYGLYTMEPSELEARLESGDVSSESDIQMMASESDFENAVSYEYYENSYGPLNEDMPEVIFKWVVPETGYYTIETIGNVDTMITSYSSPTNAEYSQRDGGTGGNVKFQIQILEGITKYFLVRKQSGSYGEIGFRIIRDDYTAGDQTNYRDVAQANYKSGNFDSNENPGACIDYPGDVDIYVFKTSPGISHLAIMNPETDLTLDVFTVEGTQTNGFDDLWKELSLCENFNQNESVKLEQTGYSSGFTYFEIKETTIGSWPNNLFGYVFNFYPSNYKDALDVAAHSTYGNTPATPTNISIPKTLTATLHRGDSDWYKFNSGTGGNLIAELSESAELRRQYEINLFRVSDVEIISADPPEWYDATNIGTVTTNSSSKTLTYSLTPNTDYFLEVTQPNNAIYNADPEDYYTLNIDIALPNSASLNGNVTLSHTAGENITSLDAFKSTIMESLTCKDGNTVIADSVAVNNVDLYYNNSLLTPAAVNGFSEGSYTIVAKYKGVAATGGTITLTVSEVVGDLVELTNIVTAAPIDFIELDWIYSALDMANSRLAHEGSPASTKTVNDVAAVFGLDPENFLVERRALGDTLKATSYFYSNGGSQSGVGFSGTTNANLLTVDEVYNKVSNGQAVIIQIVDFGHRTDMNYANYLLLCGANKTTQELKVKNYITGEVEWVPRSTLINGGYDESNPNEKSL